ncbi:hypothetical protein QQ045_013097 [Rhodiola kirilowii]
MGKNRSNFMDDGESTNSRILHLEFSGGFVVSSHEPQDEPASKEVELSDQNDKDDGYVIFTVLILHIEFLKEAFKLILIMYVLYPPEGPRPQSLEKLRVMARKNSPQKKAGAILLNRPYV